jgi:predicted RNA-binding protein associated with RNAse of E/G family
VKAGDLVRIKYIRPGKEVTYYEEDFFAQDDSCIRTFKSLPDDISTGLSASLVKQKLIQPGQRIGTISKVYFFTEPFNVLEFRKKNGELLGHYSDVGQPAIQISPNEFQMTDLFLDIWRYPNGNLLELDWDEFEEAIQKKVITEAQASLARYTMQRLIAEIAGGIYPSRYVDYFPF